jgi:serine/threonine protein kinase
MDSLAQDSGIKLIDFGLSHKLSEDELMHSVNGTPYYIAPEVLAGAYSYPIDMWSIGVMTYIMLSGTPPFNGKNNA